MNDESINFFLANEVTHPHPHQLSGWFGFPGLFVQRPQTVEAGEQRPLLVKSAGDDEATLLFA